MHIERQLAARFHAAASGRGQQVALSWGLGDEQSSWTYQQLEDRVLALVDELRRHDVGRGSVVAIPSARRAEAVAAVLALWELGAAFVPIATDDPPARRSRYVELAGVHAQLRLDPDGRLLEVRATTRRDVGAPAPRPEEQIAYVMFTSGSTGAPKAVAVPHRAVVRLVTDQDYLPFGPELTFLQAAPLNFDASVLELWGPLLHGGRCALYPDGVAPTARGLRAFIDAHGVDTAWLTASLFHSIVDDDVTSISRLRHLVVGGEQLSVPHVRRALDALPETRLVNGYGPTENTTFTTCYPIPRSLPHDAPRVPIGTPINGTEVCVVNEALQPVAAGEEGELVAMGDGLSHGYLAQTGTGPSAFVSVQAADGGVVPAYRTGDRVVQRPDGVLEFLGRFDDQVKIDGFRVEPGEAEAVIAAASGASRCRVLCRTDLAGRKRLVAYVVCAPAALQAVREHARDLLPGYLLPDHWVRMDSLPHTANGKLDVDDLPLPWTTEGTPDITHGSAALAGVKRCWAAVLGAPPSDLNLGFFDAGARSVDAMRLLTQLEQETGLALEPTFVFEFASALRQADELTSRGAWSTPNGTTLTASSERQA